MYPSCFRASWAAANNVGGLEQPFSCPRGAPTVLTPDKAHLSEPRIPSPSRVVTFALKLLRYIKTLIANVICEGSGRVVDQVLYAPTADTAGRIRPRGASVASPGPGTLLALHVPAAPEALSERPNTKSWGPQKPPRALHCPNHSSRSWARPSNKRSSPERATSCRPIGSPLWVKLAGRLRAGWPLRLNAQAKATLIVSPGPLWPWGGSGDHVGSSEQISQVGVAVGTNLGHHIPGVVALCRAKCLPGTSRIPKLHRAGDVLDHLSADQLLQRPQRRWMPHCRRHAVFWWAGSGRRQHRYRQWHPGRGRHQLRSGSTALQH